MALPSTCRSWALAGVAAYPYRVRRHQRIVDLGAAAVDSSADFGDAVVAERFRYQRACASEADIGSKVDFAVAA